jgi:hypothetical protein
MFLTLIPEMVSNNLRPLRELASKQGPPTQAQGEELLSATMLLVTPLVDIIRDCSELLFVNVKGNRLAIEALDQGVQALGELLEMCARVKKEAERSGRADALATVVSKTAVLRQETIFRLARIKGAMPDEAKVQATLAGTPAARYVPFDEAVKAIVGEE